jgi:hypothetical protein
MVKVKAICRNEKEHIKSVDTIKVFPQEVEGYDNNKMFPIISVILVICFSILAIILMFR